MPEKSTYGFDAEKSWLMLIRERRQPDLIWFDMKTWLATLQQMFVAASSGQSLQDDSDEMQTSGYGPYIGIRYPVHRESS